MLPVMEPATLCWTARVLLDPLAISGIQARRDQRARRLDSIERAAAPKLSAPCLLTPCQGSVCVGRSVYARAGSRASRHDRAEDNCRKQSAFCLHDRCLSSSDPDIGRWTTGHRAKLICHDLASFHHPIPTKASGGAIRVPCWESERVTCCQCKGPSIRSTSSMPRKN